MCQETLFELMVVNFGEQWFLTPFFSQGVSFSQLKRNYR